MKKLAIIRHANFNAGEAAGNSQSEDLASRLEKFIASPRSMVVLTSTVDRTWLTAKPICRKFGLTHIESDILWWTTKEHRCKAPYSIELIEEYAEKAEIIVIITHSDYLDWLPAQIAEKYLGIGFTGGDHGYARGWLFDLEHMQIEEV